MVSGSFHSAPAVLFTFPSRYFSTIGHQVVFRLGGWSPRLLTGFHVSADTLDTARLHPSFVYETITPYGRLFHTVRLDFFHHNAVRTLEYYYSRLASSAFARHYSRNLV